MVDIVGPSGQPLPSNPLLSQQGASSTVSIDTKKATKAFEDLQRTLDNIMKSFTVNWEKTSKDRLAAEERFYRAVGDKAKERQVMLQRFSKDALDAIDKEKDAALKALEQQGLAQEELEKRKTEISKKATEDRAKIETETAKKLAQDKSLLGRIGGGISSLGGQIGGPIGGLISGAGNIIANPAEVIPAAIVGSLIEMGNTAAAFNRTGSQLAGAGLRLGAGGREGIDFATQLFGGPLGRLGQALSQEQQRELIGQMAGSRTMIDQARSRSGFEAVRGNLGLFANVLPDASKEMELFTDATKSLGMTQRDITSTFVSSRVNAERLKITQLDAIHTQMEMQKALRNITNDGAVAANVLSSITDYLNKIGASEAEKARIGVAVAQAGTNLPFNTIIGMSAFLNNGRIPTPEAMFGLGAFGVSGSKVGILPNIFRTLGGFLTKVGSQFHDPTQRMLVAGQLQQQFLPGLRMQDIPQFFNLTQSMMRPGANMAEFEKQFRTLEGKTPQVLMAQGIDRLSAIVGPIQRLENVFTNFWTMIDERWNKLLDAIHNPLHLFHMPFKGLGKWTSSSIIHKPSGQSGR